MNVLEIIKRMEEEKRQAKKAPSHVMFIDLQRECIVSGMSKEELSKELNRLYKAGEIDTGKTINDRYIKSI